VFVFVFRISVINKGNIYRGWENWEGRDDNIKTDLKLRRCLDREFWLVRIRHVQKHIKFATS